jgi:hypothetical protein
MDGTKNGDETECILSTFPMEPGLLGAQAVPRHCFTVDRRSAEQLLSGDLSEDTLVLRSHNQWAAALVTVFPAYEAAPQGALWRA